MEYIFLLSGDYIDIGKEEVLSLFNIKNSKLLNNMLIADLKNYNENEIKKISERLALTKNIYKLLFECKINELAEKMKVSPWTIVAPVV